MINKDTRINNVAAGALSGRAIVDISGVTLVLMRDAAQAPRGAALSEPVLGVHFGILRDPSDLSQY